MNALQKPTPNSWPEFDDEFTTIFIVPTRSWEKTFTNWRHFSFYHYQNCSTNFPGKGARIVRGTGPNGVSARPKGGGGGPRSKGGVARFWSV